LSVETPKSHKKKKLLVARREHRVGACLLNKNRSRRASKRKRTSGVVEKKADESLPERPNRDPRGRLGDRSKGEKRQGFRPSRRAKA